MKVDLETLFNSSFKKIQIKIFISNKLRELVQQM